MTIEQIKAEIKERLAQTNVNREEQASKVDVPDYFSGLFDGVANGFDQVLVLLDQLEPSWHEYPKERPPKDTFYRVTVDIGIGTSVTDLCYHSRTDVWMFNGGKVCKAPVLAWMELPKPYKKESTT